MIRWGVAGTGGIAGLFTETVAEMGGTIVAVGSRSAERAKAFAVEHDLAGIHDSYDGLAYDPTVDAVYVATAAPEHTDVAVGSLAAGKPVLIEKPMALTMADASLIATASRETGLFAMEAMWPRFLPAYHELARLLDEHRIGEVRVVEAAFGFAADYAPERRTFQPEHGGGALSDAGPYPIQLAHRCLGTPLVVHATGTVLGSGVDGQVGMLLPFPDGFASLTCAITTTLGDRARIEGTDGWIVLPSLTSPQHLEVYDRDGEMERIDAPAPAPRLSYEITHAEECIETGLIVSPIMPLAESVAIARTLELARGLVLG